MTTLNPFTPRYLNFTLRKFIPYDGSEKRICFALLNDINLRTTVHQADTVGVISHMMGPTAGFNLKKLDYEAK